MNYFVAPAITLAAHKLTNMRDAHATTISSSAISILNTIYVNYTVFQNKTCDYIFYNNFNNKCPITIIFGIVSSKSMSHRKMVSIPTSPI